jgi:Nucleotidyltransferase domain
VRPAARRAQNGRVSPNPRWRVAEDVAAAVLRRYPDEVHAIGVHGSLAHGDDVEGSDVDLVVVTHRPGSGPQPTSRRVNGVIVDCGVISAAEYLAHATTLSTSWPLAADQYVTTKPIYDPDGWHERLRDTHLARLAEAGSAEFTGLAREAWGPARSAVDKAMRLAVSHDTEGALLTLGSARLATALVDGLLSRTYFRDGADALRRTGAGAAGLAELDRWLAAQAEELAKRGAPVDATPEDVAGAALV